MGGGCAECTGGRSRHGLWGSRIVGLLALPLAFSLATFHRHLPSILTVASFLGHSRVAAANSLGDVDGSLYPQAASVASWDTNGHGDEEREEVAREGNAALAANNVQQEQQRYPPAYIELQKGIDLYVRIFSF